MKPVELLQGKWLGHPLHPAIVHVPIGLWIVAAILDYVGRDAARDSVIPLLAIFCVGTGLVGALLAVPTGVADWSSIKKEKPAWKLGLYHLALNLLAAILWAANFGLRWTALSTPHPITPPILATSTAGAVLVVLSGYLGSLMVFDHGISVARQSKAKWRRQAEAGGARLPESK
ncbi:DUF2231 domain-containing protein [Opitutus sp. ER46]|uniref:DUF2231 domain-containing protein n=1 Tax=Opitutus sp. ER46 TaxID=2161864 RepID=UPI000D318514|nr:DUF2231 domain-containing protein [Opitutus sp. ER46]PTX97819.1 hypothetical protein DB354_05955 [Opitutus sp. ER46]